MASPQTRSTSSQQLPIRRPSTINPALERVFTPLMELIQLHSKKMYGASPPEVEMIFARTPQGGQPKQGTPGSPRNDWDEVWMQLSGTSLSVWSMKETKEADKRGERVPPTYYNVTGKSKVCDGFWEKGRSSNAIEPVNQILLWNYWHLFLHLLIEPNLIHTHSYSP
jgi:hypothetical protein